MDFGNTFLIIFCAYKTERKRRGKKDFVCTIRMIFKISLICMLNGMRIVYYKLQFKKM